ncbi:hypothetical protein [Roseicyclus mahoneyensis]|jgi:uncharacterized membrane protein|uniref:MAPEG family protein n=1 Tax=Roseicyclus mahoneyensis TaxID=164332 RepID=A0A316GFP7_9RHOB|nr:hypothetical protein [Roseicyclus mahoneyensis]PWK59755.1 hypothetical protein C7455_10641 [Roseicyclus mahoneyensis]
MSTGQTIQLILQSLVFLAWAILMYRTLFMLRRRAMEETGNAFPGPGQFITQVGRWLRAPEDRSDRSTLLFLTFVLFAMIATSALLGPPGAR